MMGRNFVDRSAASAFAVSRQMPINMLCSSSVTCCWVTCPSSINSTNVLRKARISPHFQQKEHTYSLLKMNLSAAVPMSGPHSSKESTMAARPFHMPSGVCCTCPLGGKSLGSCSRRTGSVNRLVKCLTANPPLNLCSQNSALA